MSTTEVSEATISEGGVITNGTFTVTSSLGQLDAGHVSTNGSYQFSCGIISERFVLKVF